MDSLHVEFVPIFPHFDGEWIDGANLPFVFQDG